MLQRALLVFAAVLLIAAPGSTQQSDVYTQLGTNARKQMEGIIAALRQQMKETAADPEQKAERDKAVPELARAAEADYREKLADWEQRYPADPKPLIARRLRDFLALSATVDFNATLEPRPGKKMRFADPELEKKPSEWKLLFRAGKPAVDAARVAAQEWLKAMGG